MHVLRSLWTWVLMLALTAALAVVLVPLITLSLGALRVPLMRLAMPLWAGAFSLLSGVRLEVSGREHLRERRPRVLVINHGSILDLPAVAALNPPAPCPLAKAELRWLPPINLVFWAMGTVWVERSRAVRAVASLQSAAERVRRQRLTALVSPEGTRSRDGRLAHFKKGAFHLAQQAGAEIVPVVVRGAWELSPPTGWTIRPGTVRIEIMPPLPPPQDPAAAAAALEERYREWLGPQP